MNFKKTLIKCYISLFYKKSLVLMGNQPFLFDFFLNCPQRIELFEIFRKIFLNQCVKSYDYFSMKNSYEKVTKNHFFEDFETKKLLEKFSEIKFLVHKSIHHLSQKFFKKILFSLRIRSPKLKYYHWEKSSFSFSLIFFIAVLRFLYSGIIDLTENV